MTVVAVAKSLPPAQNDFCCCSSSY
jgi:hypothetical protein